MDLMSNQLMLRQLVLRRGLPVLDSIPTALEQIKETNETEADNNNKKTRKF